MKAGKAGKAGARRSGTGVSRRELVGGALRGVVGGVVGGTLLAGASEARAAVVRQAGASTTDAPRIRIACKLNMVEVGETLAEKFAVVRAAGFEGVEIFSPEGVLEEALAASRETGLAIPGVVNRAGWKVRLSDRDPAVRAQALASLMEAIREAHALGASNVLVIPGKVLDPEHENHQQVWERAQAALHAAVPLAAELGVHLLVENVWNNFGYDPEGGSAQTAEPFCRFIDEAKSPWVAMYFDAGNHAHFGPPQEWIRTLGRRIVKVDLKDRDFSNAKKVRTKLGEGSIDWGAVKAALQEIGYAGWISAEVPGGDGEHLKDVAERLRRLLVY